MSEYWAPTKSGNKGPFSVDQLEQLVAAGRLPRAMDVIEVTSELQIALDDLLPPTAGAATPPSPPPAVLAAPEAPPAPAPRRAPSRGGSRAAPARGGSRGAIGGARGARTLPSRGRGRGPAYVPKKSKTPLILGIVIGVVALGGLGIWQWNFNAPLEGVWKIDIEKLRDLALKDEGVSYSSMSETEKMVLDGMLAAFTDQLTLEITESKMTFTGMGLTESATYRVVKRAGPAITLETTDSDGKKEIGVVIVRRNQLLVPEPDTPGGVIPFSR